MKKSISIQIEAEQLNAIQFYVAKRDSALETELEEFVQKLYEKYVPRETREYIERANEKPEGSQRPRPRRVSSALTGGAITEEGNV